MIPADIDREIARLNRSKCGAWSWSGPGDEHCGADDERRKA